MDERFSRDDDPNPGVPVKRGRPTAAALATPPDSRVVEALINGSVAPRPSTPAERVMATERLLAAGHHRLAIAQRLQVDPKTVHRYIRRIQEEPS